MLDHATSEGADAQAGRCCRYGVKADYAKAFGTAILRGVKKAIMIKQEPAEGQIALPGPEAWTPECEAAWVMLWDRVSNCLTR